MESKGTTEATERPAATKTDSGIAQRRRRNGNDADPRYFLVKPGSSPAKPELGQEMASEGEALIEAFRSGQPFYTVTAWKAVPEVNGGNPVIVKQAISQKTA
ncbi:MAG TPA: hypothetical protein VJP02_11830 [Candidatus Sulfotelmatobacter sp.]|nr:hypothetical protein [Candidatus Sulfotelmatobacter sp.]